VWAVYTARSLVAEGDVDLDEFPAVQQRTDDFQLDRIDGGLYYAVPLGTSLAAVPVVGAASLVAGPAVERAYARGEVEVFDALTAALLVTLTALVVFATALRMSRRTGVAAATAVAFALGIQAWSTASRTLWMHTPSMLCLALALYCAVRIDDGRRWSAGLGVALGLAYFVRPTNAVAVACLLVWVATRGRPALTRALGGLAATAAAFVVADLLLYGRPLQPYFGADRLAVTWDTPEALLGNLVSPSRGLLVYVPLTLLAAYAVVTRIRARTVTGLEVAVAATVAGTWVVVSCFPHWWGGWSYGARFFTDVSPLLAFLLVPVFVRITTPDPTAAGGRRPLLLVTVLVLGASVLAQASGAWRTSTVAWNATPRDVDEAPERLWDWHDPQMLR
jgi:4-amino-4-deoxy-L-arabinose transferase-like glycosyltransferase